jgi:hypothetical protein
MNKYPALHNAMWPGLVGKGPDSEPPIDLETMLRMTVAAEVDGQRSIAEDDARDPYRTSRLRTGSPWRCEPSLA